MKRILLCTIILSALLVSCSDNDKFSSDASSILSFSVDSLAMDTVFVSTSTRTYDFWVYNRGDAGLRIREVRLDHPSKAGFRVNVDGNYVDSVAYDFEIRKGDSLRVFVELTAPDVQEDIPQRIEDHLIFALENGREQPMKLSAYSWKAIIYKDELVVSEDMLIDEQRPLVFMKGIVVREGATLSISQAQLHFHDGAGVEVYGTLNADNCLFRGDRLDRMFSYLPYDHVSGQWEGIHFYSSSLHNELVATEIHSSMKGIVCDSAALDMTRYRLLMQRCVVHNCQGDGLRVSNANIRLEDCQLTNTEGDCLNINGGMAEIHYCTLAQFYPFSAARGAALRFSNAAPLLQLDAEGLILTGYADDVLMGEQVHASHEFNYSFRHCLLRTPAITDDTAHFNDIIWEKPDDEIQGKDHFVRIDEDHLDYDFHLDAKSPAQGLGCYR